MFMRIMMLIYEKVVRDSVLMMLLHFCCDERNDSAA